MEKRDVPSANLPSPGVDAGPMAADGHTSNSTTGLNNDNSAALAARVEQVFDGVTSTIRNDLTALQARLNQIFISMMAPATPLANLSSTKTNVPLTNAGGTSPHSTTPTTNLQADNPVVKSSIMRPLDANGSGAGSGSGSSSGSGSGNTTPVANNVQFSVVHDRTLTNGYVSA